MRKTKIGRREQQFRSWCKQEGIEPGHGTIMLDVLKEFNKHLWSIANKKSKTPVDVQVMKFSMRKWVQRLMG